MKFTLALYQQHLGRTTRKLWQMKRERIIPVTNSHSILASMGYEVVDAKTMVEDIRRKERFIKVEDPIFDPPTDVVEDLGPQVPVRLYESNCALQAGLDQAKLLTNTVVKEGEFLEQYKVNVPEGIDKQVQRIITTSAIFDAHQELLPKIKDPERPMFVFPRLYGITQYRKTCNIINKMLQFCECITGHDVAKKRYVGLNNDIVIRMERFGKTVECNITADVLLRSSEPLEPVASVGKKSNYEMPNIYPLSPLISMPNVQKSEEYRRTIWTKSLWQNAHTAVFYHSPETVQNFTKLPVIEDQIMARTLMNIFTVAANSAMQMYQNQIDQLPNPITVQCVQTDGQDFLFSVFQLNGMHDDIVNYWWMGPKLRLYEKAQYENGRPVFSEYNKNVFTSLLGFYRHQ